jgi:hypothetical protein
MSDADDLDGMPAQRNGRLSSSARGRLQRPGARGAPGTVRMSAVERVVQQLIAEGERDYIALYLITGAAQEAAAELTASSTRERTLALLTRMLDRGFLAVDLADEGKCRPWPEQDQGFVLERIRREWPEHEDNPLIGMLYWFHWPKSGVGMKAIER